jgi:hypothetical protein
MLYKRQNLHINICSLYAQKELTFIPCHKQMWNHQPLVNEECGLLYSQPPNSCKILREIMWQTLGHIQHQKELIHKMHNTGRVHQHQITVQHTSALLNNKYKTFCIPQSCIQDTKQACKLHTITFQTSVHQVHVKCAKQVTCTPHRATPDTHTIQSLHEHISQLPNVTFKLLSYVY